MERIKGEIKSLYDESRSQASLESFVENFRTNRQFYVDDDEEFLGTGSGMPPYLCVCLLTSPPAPIAIPFCLQCLLAFQLVFTAG